ncbi:hypothetical protein [Curtobacterium sp. UCD-KPL2560]|uniref:hypothetical protein n=1 Tax=Curtobacterium sp. UCD-KPL2560 TaxID=1885315 RepID=UPI00114CBD6B|nr:hypothetical protein [Curtobacterium sp. UCD-KPL2560]
MSKNLTINGEIFALDEVVFAGVLELGAELDRLRAVIESAPHLNSCRMFDPASRKCTCWKADVL